MTVATGVASTNEHARSKGPLAQRCSSACGEFATLNGKRAANSTITRRTNGSARSNNVWNRHTHDQSVLSESVEHVSLWFQHDATPVVLSPATDSGRTATASTDSVSSAAAAPDSAATAAVRPCAVAAAPATDSVRSPSDSAVAAVAAVAAVRAAALRSARIQPLAAGLPRATGQPRDVGGVHDGNDL